MPIAYKRLSRASWTLCINEWVAVSIDLVSVNPCCSLASMLCFLEIKVIYYALIFLEV